MFLSGSQDPYPREGRDVKLDGPTITIEVIAIPYTSPIESHLGFSLQAEPQARIPLGANPARV